jgi:cysteine desulfurase
MDRIYLDNNATTRTDPAVVAAMLPYFTEQFGNCSSAHAFGAAAADGVRRARRQLQALLGAAAEQEIVFTSGGTESDQAAILSALATQAGRDEVVTSAVEHPAVLTLLGHIEKSRGIKVHRIGVDARGRLDDEAFERSLGPRTALVSIMWANNETGTIFPVARLAQQAHDAGALFHTDAVQAAGKIPLDLAATEIDMLSLSGHKLHGPKGIGALYLRKGVKFQPLIRGGQQERGRRGGTENVPGIVGLGEAAERAHAALATAWQRVRGLRDRLETELLRRIGHCRVNGDTCDRLPNTTNLAFDYLDGEAILVHLDRAGIAASSGSACTSGSTEPSHVLRAMGLPPIALQGAIRLSLSRETTSDEIERVASVLPGIIERVRANSPLWQERAAGKFAGVPSYV